MSAPEPQPGGGDRWRTRLDGVRARLAIYQFAEEAFGDRRPATHRVCVIGGRRYDITEDLAFCVRTLTLCQHYLTRPSAQSEADLRAALSEADV